MKKFRWYFSLGDAGNSGEANTQEEAEAAMEAQGFDPDTMEGEINEVSDESLVEAARAAANPPRIKSSLQVLAEANTSLFNQVDALKNKLAEAEGQAQSYAFEREQWKHTANNALAVLLGARELVLAWNTEQQARMKTAHVEPPFVEILREARPEVFIKGKKNGNEKEDSRPEGSEGSRA